MLISRMLPVSKFSSPLTIAEARRARFHDLVQFARSLDFFLASVIAFIGAAGARSSNSALDRPAD